MVDRRHIRVKAMLVAPNAEGTAHAVSLNPRTAENPHGYHRLIGGGVELGETHRAAILREVREELSAAILDLRFLGVVENIYLIDGETGHEIVFVYAGHLDPEPAANSSLIESDGSVLPIVWRPLDDSEERLPLYPAEVRPLLEHR